jgi:hypothetical protein
MTVFTVLQIVYGTLRAADNFPKNRYLIEIGEDVNLCKKQNPSMYVGH